MLLTYPLHATPVEERVRLAIGRPKLDEQLQNISQVGENLSLEEIPTALAIAKDLKSLRERGVLLEATYKRWAKLEPAQAFGSIAKLPEGRDKASILYYAAAKFIEKDPQAAVAAIMELPAGRSRQEAIESAASTWAKLDVPSALAWAGQLPFGSPKEGALYQIRFVWVHTDPVAAAKHVAATVPAGDTKNALLTNIAAEWVLRDRQAAIDWAKGLTYPSERALALSSLAESWADQDPESALQFALELSPPDIRQRTTAMVFERWATQDPNLAVSDALKLTDPELQLAGIEAVLNLWTTIAPEEAGRWVEQLPPGAAKERAIRCYVTTAAHWAPDLGVKLVANSAPELASLSMTEDCARQWLSLDFSKASAWVGDVKLPEKVKAQWCTPVRSSSRN